MCNGNNDGDCDPETGVCKVRMLACVFDDPRLGVGSFFLLNFHYNK